MNLILFTNVSEFVHFAISLFQRRRDLPRKNTMLKSYKQSTIASVETTPEKRKEREGMFVEVDRVDQTSEKRFPFDLPKKLGAKCPYVRDVTELSEREGATERGGREREREKTHKSPCIQMVC